MKILMIEPSGKRGLCQYTHNLADALAKRDNQVLLATAIEFETRNLPGKHEALEVFDRFFPRPIRLLRFFFHIKKFKADVIHIQGAIHPGFYFILWKVLKIMTTHNHFVYTSHDIFPKRNRKYTFNILNRIYNGIPHIIVHAKQNKEQLIQNFNTDPDKISVLSVGNNMAISKYLKMSNKIQIPLNKKVILFFGVIEPQKGLMTLIRALPEIKKSVYNTLLFIVGQPFRNMNQYLEEIKRLNIEDSVKLKLGYVPIDEIPGIFKVAHLLVLPYSKVSQSGVILSAYAFGKPVVATSVGGISELVDDGKTGFLIPPENSKALAKAVIRLLENEELRKKMGGNALNLVRKNHSWDIIAEKTEYIYRSLGT